MLPGAGIEGIPDDLKAKLIAMRLANNRMQAKGDDPTTGFVGSDCKLDKRKVSSC